MKTVHKRRIVYRKKDKTGGVSMRTINLCSTLKLAENGWHESHFWKHVNCELCLELKPERF